LWNTNLYAPLLLVDPSTRKVLANFPDTSHILRKEGEIYTGILPDDVNIANTALEWGGVRWAMIMLPLPESKEERLNLILHELFHSVQPGLGFTAYSPGNDHLDKKGGRVYLRLELEALKKALTADSNSEAKRHLANAFSFRKFRRQLYPGSDTTENHLELNEGLAEYTGVMCSGRGSQAMKAHFIDAIENFFSYPSYTRSFAYQTIPVYGYLLSRESKYWNLKINGTMDITDFFINEFNPVLLENIYEIIKDADTLYGRNKILQEETEREKEITAKLAGYRNKFVKNPHLNLFFENMSISFDPRDITPLDEHGSVYPNIRVVDNWGILTVESGSLLSPSWNKITVSEPLEIKKDIVSGDGWILKLNKGWGVEKQNDGNYKLIKK
ncbi:MAG TPA: hypothetical protein VHO28_08620, partial [Ignavibacteriales bacterium]|nr:hypothetical protein [Ignavibacteriales bacterium]